MGKIGWKNYYKICQFLEPNSGFPIWKNSGNLLIFQIVKLWKFPIWKFTNFPMCKIKKKKTICKIQKIFDLEKSKNFEFGKFQKCLIQQISQISNLGKYENSKNFPFNKLSYILSVGIIQVEIKINVKFENKKSNNLTFVILIFEISKVRNIGRSIFRCSKYWPPHEINRKKS